MSSSITIVNIARDRQTCVDSSGKKYTLKDVKINSHNMDVCVRKNISKKTAFPEIIVYKKNSKKSAYIGSMPLRINDIEVDTKDYNYGKGSSEKNKLCIILEDKGSAKYIIQAIVQKYAIIKSIYLECTYVYAKGGGNIPTALNYYINHDMKKCLVIFDSAIENAKILTNIKDTVAFINKSNINCLTFEPKCIEECALSFGYLKNDIIGLSKEQLEILQAANNYLKTGIESKFIEYDMFLNTYTLNGKPIKFGYPSLYISKYKKIDSVERYIVDKLAGITHGKPYSFEKSANECWYCNCECLGYQCILEKILGCNRPNSRVGYCNKTLVGTDKTGAIIRDSLFGGIYDAINILFGNKNTSILNTKIEKKIIRRYI